MVKLMGLTQKPSLAVAVAVILWALLLLPLLLRLVPLVPHSWNLMVTILLRLLILIKRPPFIYIIFNFIIIYILLSSTFSLHLKLYRKPKTSLSSSPPKLKPKHALDETTSSSWERDDTWWRQIADVEKTTSFEASEGGAEEGIVDDLEEGKTGSFEAPPQEVVKGSISAEDEKQSENIKRVEDEEEEREEGADDTLDATWQAIMEAKRNGSGPQLKKSDTWTAGDRRGGVEEQVNQLKKWQTFKAPVDERDTGGKGGGRGGEGRWRKVEAVVTYHDELKKRADAFIARFTHDIRLQRLESHQRFLEMINRGL